MPYLFSVLSRDYDLLCKVTDSETKKEELTMLLIAFSSSDLFSFLKHEDFYYSIDKQYCWNVSVLFTKFGYTLLFVHSQNDTRKFLDTIEHKLGEMVLNPYFEASEVESFVKNTYRRFYNE